MRGPRTLAGRLFLGVAAVVVTLLAVLGIVLDRVLEADLVSSLTERLEAEARTVAVALPAGQTGLQAEVSRLAGAGGVRVTVIGADGVVLADSDRDPASLENHSDRPEVREALAGRVGIAVRRSESTGEEYRYLALPVQAGRVVRVAAPLTAIRAAQERVRSVVAAGILLCAVAVVVGTLLVSRSLARPLRRVATSVDALGMGDLTARAEPAGAEEVAALARTLNHMASRLEQEVGTAREEHRTRDLILSAMEEGTLLAGPDGEIRFLNRSFERLAGGRPTRVASLFPLALREAVERARDGNEPVRVELEGGPGGYWLRCSAIPAGDGQVLLVVQDVTASRRLDSVRRDFVTNASHELKTPAASIQAAAETIRHAVVDDPVVVPRFAAQLEHDAMRLSRIVSDLLDLSRLESGTESTEPVRLDALAREESGRFADEAARRGIELTVTAEEASIRGSPRDLRLLVTNLVDNALRYTGGDGRVDVTLTTADGDAVLRVSDTGIGIPTRDLPRVFERFYRVDRARSRETGGTGLGLSIVRHVVENHGGTVRVTSELGRGSTFEVRLPMERSRAASPRGRA